MEEREPTQWEQDPGITEGAEGAVGAPSTALIDPSTNEEVIRIKEEVLRMGVMALSFRVASQLDVDKANNSLQVMKPTLKRLAELRKFYVDEPNAYVKMVNAAFKVITDPLESAIGNIGKAILDYNSKVRALQEEAADLERRRVALQQQTGEITAPTPTVPVESHASNTAMGSLGTRENWAWEVVDFAALEDKLKLPDVGTITKLVKAGLRKEAGLRIWDQGSIATRARKEG